MSIFREDGEWIREDDDGNCEVVTPPEEWLICGQCRGDGKCLPDGMRGHAYSMEEFHESFDYEERDMYFNGGYDVGCSECRGSGKVKAVDWDRLRIEDPELAKEIDDYYQCQADMEAEHEAERRYGC